MRRVLILLAGLVVAASCQKAIEEQNIDKPQKWTVLKAEVEQIAQPNSKSTIELEGAGAKFKWSEGDEIAVMTDAGLKKFFLQANPEDTNKIEFITDEECTPQDGAIYPYAVKYEGLNRVNLPTTYGALNTPYNEDTNMPMLASLEDDKLSFKHLGGVAMFPIENLPAKAAQFIFTATGKKITGEFGIVTSGEYQVINTSNSESSNAVTINFECFGTKQETTSFYIPLPCGEYTGFTIQIKDATDKDLVSCTSTRAFTVNRANVKVFSGFDCDEHLLPVEIVEMSDANSFILPLNSDKAYKIPTERVNTFWKDEKGGYNLTNALDYETPFSWVPEVIWIESTTGDITESDKANVVFYNENGYPQSEFTGNVPFYVQVDSEIAINVLIGIKRTDSHKILWSWHLWLTDYNPNAATPANGQVHTYNSYTVMDRNLGAMITGYNGYSQLNPVEKPGIRGLYYQFGRKDPFPTNIYPNEKRNTSQQGYDYSVYNPYTFINHSGDWHTPTNDEYPWNGSSNEKSIYDPCPAGWRVPTIDVWSDFDKSDFEWTDGGRIYRGQAWYPAAGNHSDTEAKITHVGSDANYWSASPYVGHTGNGYRMSINNLYVGHEGQGHRSLGCTVRCVQDK